MAETSALNVSPEYLSKMRRALRIEQSDAVDEEITDLIIECRRDLSALGVRKSAVCDESDYLVLGVIRCFVRWRFGLLNPDADRMRDEYMMLRDEIRRRGDYCISPTG
jgi:hypothetical protein